MPTIKVSMQANPIVERLEGAQATQRAQEAFRYPFHIVCVYQDSDNNDFPIILETRDYCNRNNLIFSAREYDIDKHEYDMFIKRLPAFHFFYKKGWQELFYFDTNPVHQIQCYVWKYQDEMKAKEKARQRNLARWNALKETVHNFVTLKHLKRKPALDLDASLSHARDEPKKLTLHYYTSVEI